MTSSPPTTLFTAFEDIGHAGNTARAHRILNRMNVDGHPCIAVQELDKKRLVEQARSIITNVQYESDEAEMMLFCADRGSARRRDSVLQSTVRCSHIPHRMNQNTPDTDRERRGDTVDRTPSLQRRTCIEQVSPHHTNDARHLICLRSRNRRFQRHLGLD